MAAAARRAEGGRAAGWPWTATRAAGRWVCGWFGGPGMARARVRRLSSEVRSRCRIGKDRGIRSVVSRRLGLSGRLSCVARTGLARGPVARGIGCAAHRRGKFSFGLAGVSRPGVRARVLSPGRRRFRPPPPPTGARGARGVVHVRPERGLRFASPASAGRGAPSRRRRANPRVLAGLPARRGRRGAWHRDCSATPVRDAWVASYHPSLPSPARLALPRSLPARRRPTPGRRFAVVRPGPPRSSPRRPRRVACNPSARGPV